MKHNTKPPIRSVGAEPKPLDAVIFARSNFLTRVLAGAVAINTLHTLKEIERLRDNDLTDLKARSFIFGMREKLPDLQAADEDGIIQIIMHVCKDKNCLLDYAYWITLVKDATQDAIQAVKELQSLAITQRTLAVLQNWVGEVEIMNSWR